MGLLRERYAGLKKGLLQYCCNQVRWSNITLFLPKTCRDCISSARKSYQACSLAIILHAGGIWKGDILVADIEELEEMDASEIHSKRLNAKEVSMPQNGGKCFFPIADGTVKLSGVDQVLRASAQVGDRPDR